MAWTIGNQEVDKFEDYNQIVKEMSGTMDDATARITLAKFLKTNLAWTMEHFSGFELMPIQEVILKGLFLRDNCMVVAGRGFSKSTLISIFSILYSIIYPEKKICLISANFRSSRRILEASEKIVNSKKAQLLRDCFPNTIRRGNDIYSWKIANGSEIFALPLSNGDGLRGTRSNLCLIDEGLLISQEIQETILRPFLTVNQDFQEESDVRKAEDLLIKEGKIVEADRLSFPRNKFCVFSSASYEFQYLYTLYKSWIDFINNPQKIEAEPGRKKSRFFVMRASYEALPPNGLMDMSQINSAKAAGGENSESFKREYRALFSKTGEGYFSAAKLFKCTIPLGDYPTAQLKGDKDAEYILSIDPSYSASKSSDHFAMGVYLLIPEQKKIVLVHSYAVAGADLKSHYEYLSYILRYFNIVFICIDGSGSEFLSSFNESTIAKEFNFNLKFLDVDFCSDEYLEEVSKAKSQYNQLIGRIVYAQTPSSQSNRYLNEHLQNQIDSEKVWFGSPLGSNEEEAKKYADLKMPIPFKDKSGEEMKAHDLISEQDSLIEMTKNQTALIEVRVSVNGATSYDLPQHLRRETGNNRSRRDSYMCLALACWGARHLYSMRFTEGLKNDTTFEPFFIG